MYARRFARSTLNIPRADLERLQSLQVKRKLEDNDILYLKETLPSQMFESFMLDRLGHIVPAQDKPTQEDQHNLQNFQNAEIEDDYEVNWKASDSESNLSTEFRALKQDLKKKFSTPVFSIQLPGRLQYHGHWQERRRQDFVC